MNIQRIAACATESKIIRKSLRQKPYHWVFVLLLLVVAVPAAILTCGILLPVKLALKSKALLGKWLFGAMF
jgi:hypothetical protein